MHIKRIFRPVLKNVERSSYGITGYSELNSIVMKSEFVHIKEFLSVTAKTQIIVFKEINGGQQFYEKITGGNLVILWIIKL